MNAALIAQLLVIAEQLLTLINSIHTETQKTSPEVWNQVNSQYVAALEAWQRASQIVNAAALAAENNTAAPPSQVESQSLPSESNIQNPSSGAPPSPVESPVT